MKEAINQLTYSLTGKEHIEQCTEDELRQMVRLYPFFGPAHLLLAKKNKITHADESGVFTQKASVYFSNSLWFDELMNEEELAEADLGNTPGNELHNTILETPSTFEEVVPQDTGATNETASSVYEETVMETPATLEEVVPQVNEEEEQEVRSTVKEQVLETPFTKEEVVVQVNEKTSPSDDYDEEDQSQAPVLPALKIEPLDAGKMELSFEPYHTVDYFASQGIRFKEEEKPKDRLSHQLKSFTEWLKTLKKLPASEIPAGANRQEEKKVEQMAQVSITDREVVTEAMAEVWEKQGNAVKAVELYEKLSLLDPSKSSYFAAKIEHLKQL